MASTSRNSVPMLLVTTAYEAATLGGRELLTALHRDALAEILGPDLLTFQLPREAPRSNARKLFAGTKGHIDGVSAETLAAILDIVRTRSLTRVFLDGSNLGAIASHLRRFVPGIWVFTFCHNVEARFFWGAFRGGPSAKALAVAAVNYGAEHRAVRHSSTLICINERDSRLMRRVHGRGGDAISHMSLRDSTAGDVASADARLRQRNILFVGGSFYANRRGIEWFARHVSPRLSLPTYVVGRGFDESRSELESFPNVVVVGEVEHLTPWYRAADCVVAPIFDGSGMKTKVAEALMHGKRVVGTPEAYVGYEAIPERLRVSCNSADEFVSAIEGLDRSSAMNDEADLRALYETHYSFDATKRRLERILALAPR